MEVAWSAWLLAFMHDPPDKALSIHGHIPRARDNAKVALGDDAVSRKRIEDNVTEADPRASLVERVPMPRVGPGGERAVGVKDGQLRIFHPLSAVAASLSVPALDSALIAAQKVQLEKIAADLAGEEEPKCRNRFLAIWRLWAESLANDCHPSFSRLPADTRTPDHTIWHHLDMTAAFKAAEVEGQGAALLTFAVGPVQRFIEAARSVRDLWSGSMILSWIAFHALRPVIELLGPTALIYPAMRGIPLLDLWLRDSERLGDKVPLPGVDLRLTPSLPHRFLALVPWGREGALAKGLATQCRNAASEAWLRLSATVKECIRPQLDAIAGGWDHRWNSQVEGYFSTTTAVLPLSGSGEEIDRRLARLLSGHESFAGAFPTAEAVRNMVRAIPPADRLGYDQEHAGRWQYQVELVNRSLASRRAIRHVPMNPVSSDADARFPQKCTLLGSLEQVGPDDLRESKDFWRRIAGPDGTSLEGVRVRDGEALCAVALVKRFAGPALLAHELHIQPGDLRFPDTWTVAAAEWLVQAKIEWSSDWYDENHRRVPWNGHWLHWPQPKHDLKEAGPCPSELFKRIKQAKAQEDPGDPPVYYAILKLDGDDLGGWLRGEKSPRVREVMHPDLVNYYQGLGDVAKAGLDARRPVGPTLHAAISTALANFALRAVPRIVDEHHGTTIYSGGDDTLVLLPASQALACALKLQRAYTSEYDHQDGREYLMMGSSATLSGGLVFVHAKDDLRLALQDARSAERQAKEAGRDALVVCVRRRSGEHTSALCPWPFAPTVNHWAAQFRSRASDRWAYRLHAERSSLTQLPIEAVRAEIRRQIKRSEDPTPTLLPPDQLAEAFETYRRRFDTIESALDGFLTLCLTASFLTRGRDQ